MSEPFLHVIEIVKQDIRKKYGYVLFFILQVLQYGSVFYNFKMRIM